VHSLPLIGLASAQSWHPDRTRVIAAIAGAGHAVRGGHSCDTATAAAAEKLLEW
jgi:hypothetical protein